ncbi:MAG TPA: hypothetical protein VNL91_11150 [Thermoanaerobaculia bacterium]|nr:hypothetical protein [Thermoanaerobaculia bacterium]
MKSRRLIAAFCFVSALGSPLSTAQQEPPHDITKVDPAPLGGAIATPLTHTQQRRLKKYEIPELVGARQALGSQLIDGRLPRPLVDYYAANGGIEQRLSIFEGGLVVVTMNGAGATIRKRVILPADAVGTYLGALSFDALADMARNARRPPEERRAFVRVYRGSEYAEVAFDPAVVMDKRLHDGVFPLEDLLRAISEDRTVTNTVANYEPAVGDELVGDDSRTWRVKRIAGDVIELECLGQPTVIYVARSELYNYFIGRR